ncbi:hypothetical protein UlMin_017534 [Ulmus minor]
MADQKVTIMVLKVDLQCCRCYRKIKRVLCKFPEIRDQAFDEKTNTIVIKVVSCNPEKIKQKIICKAGHCLKSIEIKEPEKPKPKPPPPPPPAPAPPPPPPPAPAPPPPPPPPKPEPQPPPKCCPPPVFGTCCSDCYHGHPGGPCYRGYGGPPPASPKLKPHPVPGCYQPPAFDTCYSDCYRGYDGPPPQCYQYDGYCGRPVYDSYGGCSIL